MEGCARRELEDELVARELDRPRLGEHRPRRDRALGDRRQHAPLPRLLERLEVDGRRLREQFRGLWYLRRRLLRGRGSSRPVLQQLDAVGERLAREIRRRPRHLHERELERQARVAALAHVVDGDGQ